MHIIYSSHARMRMKQRGVNHLEVEHVLSYSSYVKKTFGLRKSAVGKVNNRQIKIVYIEKENYIKVITIL